MDQLQARVAQGLFEDLRFTDLDQDARSEAAANAIRTVIEAMAQEADAESDPDDHDWGPLILWPDNVRDVTHLADWLRSHLEATDARD